MMPLMDDVMANLDTDRTPAACMSETGPTPRPGVLCRPVGGAISPVRDDPHGQLVHVIGSGKLLFDLGHENFGLLRTAACDVRRYVKILGELNLK